MPSFLRLYGTKPLHFSELLFPSSTGGRDVNSVGQRMDGDDLRRVLDLVILV